MERKKMIVKKGGSRVVEKEDQNKQAPSKFKRKSKKSSKVK